MFTAFKFNKMRNVSTFKYQGVCATIYAKRPNRIPLFQLKKERKLNIWLVARNNHSITFLSVAQAHR